MSSERTREITPVSLTWTRHIEYRFRRFTKPVLVMLSIGVALMVITPIIGAPLMMTTGLAAMLYPLPIMLPQFSRLKVEHSYVAVYKVASPFAWWAALALLLGMGMLLQTFTGGADSGRLLIPGIVAILVVVPLSTYQAHKQRGPLKISGTEVLMRGPAPAFDLASVSLSFKCEGSAPPAVTLYQSLPGRRKHATGDFPCLVYGLDFDTLYSTLEQLRAWSRAGRIATPQQIKAMLNVKPPKGLAVGESVEIPLS